MQKVLPVLPISDLRQKQAEILAMLDQSPVLLMNRGDAAGVLVSVDQWNSIADELAVAKRNTIAAKNFVRMDGGDYVSMTAAEILALGQ